MKRGESEFDSFRQSLPVFEKREEIVKLIKDNKVVLIVGETGSGKTTQVCFINETKKTKYLYRTNFNFVFYLIRDFFTLVLRLLFSYIV